MISLKCDRCGTVVSAETEIDAERALDLHQCKEPPLNKLPFDLLRKLAYGELTEEEAWAIAQSR